MLCAQLKDEIIANKAKVVFRPDSGDMMEIVPQILRMQEAAFSTALTSKGYKKINNVGIIQGDGVDHMAIKMLLGNILAMATAPTMSSLALVVRCCRRSTATLTSSLRRPAPSWSTDAGSASPRTQSRIMAR
jgi:hypothetical protein